MYVSESIIQIYFQKYWIISSLIGHLKVEDGYETYFILLFRERFVVFMVQIYLLQSGRAEYFGQDYQMEAVTKLIAREAIGRLTVKLDDAKELSEL